MPSCVLTERWRRSAPSWPFLRHLALIEERGELGDLADRLRWQPAAGEPVGPLDEIALNRALKLAERREDERPPVTGRDVPVVVGKVPVATLNLELVPTVGALHGRPTTADQRVVELVLRVAPLALDVHRAIPKVSRVFEPDLLNVRGSAPNNPYPTLGAPPLTTPPQPGPGTRAAAAAARLGPHPTRGAAVLRTPVGAPFLGLPSPVRGFAHTLTQAAVLTLVHGA